MLKTVFKNLKSIALFLPLFMLLFSADAFAVPANSTPMEYTQSDGSKITVSLRGDEFFHFYTDMEGYKRPIRAVIIPTENWKIAG